MKKQLKTIKKENKGITLIALVITVIVLLILAGVSISMLSGDNSILQKTTDAKKATETASAQEQIQIQVLGSYDKYADLNLEELTSNLQGIGATVTGNTFPITATLNGANYTIDEDGNVKVVSEDPTIVIPKVSDANPGVMEGTGTEADPYTINCIEDLVAFAYEVNNNGNLYENKIVTLGCDLDFKNDNSYMDPTKLYIPNGKGYFEATSGGKAIKEFLDEAYSIGNGWIPIGKGDNDGFAGTFDGKNHTISNLYMKPYSYGGLFGKTNKAITIKNLGLVNCNVSSAQEVGGILGRAEQPISIINCYCSGNIERVSTSESTGGLLGHAQNGGTIINCYNNCNISTHGIQAGGLVGCASADILKVTNAFNSGNITSSNSSSDGKTMYNDGWNGGIAGYASGLNAYNLYNVGNIDSTCINVGGIAGAFYRNSSTLYNCFNSGNIFATHGQVGGIVGYCEYPNISHCHNIGDIMSDSTSTSSYHIELGEMFGYSSNGDQVVGQNCTYLNKDSNANSNGATGMDDMTETMSLSNFVNLMNSYVTENNNDSTKEKLRTWTLKDGIPVFAK